MGKRKIQVYKRKALSDHYDLHKVKDKKIENKKV